MSRIFCLTCLMLLPLSAVRADMHECDGVWTNKPCEELKKSAEANDVQTGGGAGQTKESVIEQIYQYQAEMEKEGVNFPAGFIETKCQRGDVSVEDCRKEFEAKKTLAENELQRRKLRSQ